MNRAAFLLAVLTLVGAPALAARPACSVKIGESAAAQLVSDCESVSPKDDPACKPTQPCGVIKAEIRAQCRAEFVKESVCHKYVGHPRLRRWRGPPL